MCDELDKINDFEHLCDMSIKSNPAALCMKDMLKITTEDGKSKVFNGNGNRVSYDSIRELVDEL